MDPAKCMNNKWVMIVVLLLKSMFDFDFKLSWNYYVS